jgi:hypothetical protein
MKVTQKILIAGLLSCVCLACGTPPPQPAAQAEPTPAPTVEIKPKTFADDLETIRYNSYKYIFVLRRKDGKAINGDNGKFIRANSPSETNQRLVSDDGKAVIMGTNFRFYPGQWDALHKEFDFQDMSEVKYQRSEIDDIPKENPHSPKRS